MLRIAFFLLLLSAMAFSMTACGGADSGESAVNPTSDVVLGRETFLEVGANLPLDDSQALLVDLADLAPGTFRAAAVLEDETRSFSGSGSFTEQVAQGTYLYMSTSLPDGGVDQGVTFVLPADLAPGTYAVYDYAQVFNLTQQIIGVGATYITAPPPAYSLPFYSYDVQVEGVLTLTEVDPMTGAFRFSASDPEGIRAELSGTFNALPIDFDAGSGG